MDYLFLVIFTSVAVFLGNLAVLFLIYRSFKAFNEAPEGLRAVVLNFTKGIGSETAQSLKAVFMGVQSGQARQQQRVEEAVETDLLAGANPLLGLAANMPTVQKFLKKNPALKDAAMEYAARKFGSGNAEASADDNGNFAEELAQLGG